MSKGPSLTLPGAFKSGLSGSINLGSCDLTEHFFMHVPALCFCYQTLVVLTSIFTLLS